MLFVTYSTWNIGLLMHMSDAQHHCARFIYHSHLLDVQVPLAALPSRGSGKHPWFQIQLQRRWFSFWKITMAFHGMKTATNHTLTLIHPPISTSTGWIFRCFSHVLPPALPMLRPAGASKASTHNVDKGFSRTTAASPACNSGGRMTKI